LISIKCGFFGRGFFESDFEKEVLGINCEKESQKGISCCIQKSKLNN